MKSNQIETFRKWIDTRTECAAIGMRWNAVSILYQIILVCRQIFAIWLGRNRLYITTFTMHNRVRFKVRYAQLFPNWENFHLARFFCGEFYLKLNIFVLFPLSLSRSRSWWPIPRRRGAIQLFSIDQICTSRNKHFTIIASIYFRCTDCCTYEQQCSWTPFIQSINTNLRKI